MAFACLNLWAAVHYWLASRTLAEDLARVAGRGEAHATTGALTPAAPAGR